MVIWSTSKGNRMLMVAPWPEGEKLNYEFSDGACYSDMHIFSRGEIKRYLLALGLRLCTVCGFNAREVVEVLSGITQFKEAMSILERNTIPYREEREGEQHSVFPPASKTASLPEGYFSRNWQE
jgi:hypothetical protein